MLADDVDDAGIGLLGVVQGTRSSAATKCISEVPGLVKQTSTPPLTIVRTRLSAPFILLAPATGDFQ